MAKITYADKVNINTSAVANQNKVSDTDMNSIKNAVNDNGSYTELTKDTTYNYKFKCNLSGVYVRGDVARVKFPSSTDTNTAQISVDNGETYYTFSNYTAKECGGKYMELILGESNIWRVADEKNSINCFLNTNYSYTSTKNAVKLPMTLGSSKGAKFTMTADGGVKIGAGIDRIMVNAQVYYFTGSNHSDGKNVLIYKNSTMMGRGSARDNYNYIFVPGGPFMFDVEENDIIYLYALNDVNGATVIANGSTATFMNIISI